MSYPAFSDFPPIPQRSAPEADFDAKMYALFQHFATTHRAELIALTDFLKTNSTIIGGALNATTLGLETPAAGKFTTLLADSLGGGAVQASATDVSDGKLLKTGAFGLGQAVSLGVGDNLDLMLATGFYFNPTALNAAGNNYPVASAGSLLVIARQANNVTQRYSTYGGNSASDDVRVFERTWGGAGWTPWVEMYHQGSILGAVSQSGGVPIGALIERGSNANGEYVRFADGTQICTCQAFQTSASGSLTWTYPASFIYPASPGRPAVTGAVSTITGQGAFLAIGGIADGTSVSVRAVKHDGTLVSAATSLIAIGRWF